MSEFAQIVISADQARLLHFATEELLRKAQDPDNEDGYEATKDEINEMKRLAVFLSAVHGHPNHFPVTGRMANVIKTNIRKHKVPVPQTRKNKRKERQLKRRRFRKDQRAQRRELADQYNQALEIQEKEAKEAEAFYVETNERLASQPKFNIVDPFGNPQFEGIPAELIVAEDGSTPLLPNRIELP